MNRSVRDFIVATMRVTAACTALRWPGTFKPHRVQPPTGHADARFIALHRVADVPPPDAVAVRRRAARREKRRAIIVVVRRSS